MSGQQNRDQWNRRSGQDEDPVLEPKTARAMAEMTASMFCPRCNLPGELWPGESCPYCGYYLRCVGCGD